MKKLILPSLKYSENSLSFNPIIYFHADSAAEGAPLKQLFLNLRNIQLLNLGKSRKNTNEVVR